MRNAAVILLVLALSACSCQDKYDPFLGQVHENLVEDVRPKYAEALRASGRPEDLIEVDLGVLDDTAAAIERVRGAGPEAYQEGER